MKRIVPNILLIAVAFLPVTAVQAQVTENAEAVLEQIMTELVELLTLQVEYLKVENGIKNPDQEDLQITYPTENSDPVRQGSAIEVQWKGGNEAVPIEFRLLTNSANYYCVKTGGEICPLDVSEVISEFWIKNNGEFRLLQPTNRTGSFIAELKQGNEVAYTEQPIVIEKRETVDN